MRYSTNFTEYWRDAYLRIKTNFTGKFAEKFNVSHAVAGRRLRFSTLSIEEQRFIKDYFEIKFTFSHPSDALKIYKMKRKTKSGYNTLRVCYNSTHIGEFLKLDQIKSIIPAFRDGFYYIIGHNYWVEWEICNGALIKEKNLTEMLPA